MVCICFPTLDKLLDIASVKEIVLLGDIVLLTALNTTCFDEL